MRTYPHDLYIQEMLLSLESRNKELNRVFGGIDLTGNMDVDIPAVISLYNAHPSVRQMTNDDSEPIGFITLAQWRKMKTIYRFDLSLLEQLDVTDANVCMHMELLKRLPYHAFFLDYNGNDVVRLNDDYSSPLPIGIGSYVFISEYPNDPDAVSFSLLHVFGWDPKGSCDSYMIELTLSDEESVEECVRRHMQRFCANSTPEFVDKMVRSVLLAIQCSYYLAAQNADVKLVKEKKQTRMRTADGRHVNIRKWDVGFRIGNAYRAQSAENEEERSAGGKHNSPRPHVRRAHWHHFWCGPNRERLEVRWLSPMYVAAGMEHDSIIATSHAV